MENDTKTMESLLTHTLFGVGNTCIFCGDPTDEVVCPDCEENNRKHNEQVAQREQEKRQHEREARFRASVGHYADTDRDRLPRTAALEAVTSYIIGGKAGLTISGPGDTGKTRCVIWLALKELQEGRWVEFRQCGVLRQEVSHYAKNGEWAKGITSLMNCDILILDDLGNHEFTRTLEEFLLALLERRTISGKRTFVTTQYISEDLKKLFTSAQMADAVLRRIGRGFATTANTAANKVIPWK